MFHFICARDEIRAYEEDGVITVEVMIKGGWQRIVKAEYSEAFWPAFVEEFRDVLAELEGHIEFLQGVDKEPAYDGAAQVRSTYQAMGGYGSAANREGI